MRSEKALTVVVLISSIGAVGYLAGRNVKLRGQVENVEARIHSSRRSEPDRLTAQLDRFIKVSFPTADNRQRLSNTDGFRTRRIVSKTMTLGYVGFVEKRTTCGSCPVARVMVAVDASRRLSNLHIVEPVDMTGEDIEGFLSQFQGLGVENLPILGANVKPIPSAVLLKQPVAQGVNDFLTCLPSW